LALWKWARAWDPALEPLAASPAAALFVPVGISFYALQAIAYLRDVARGQLPPERDLVRFALYLAWFPKLLAGPIERARPFLAQLARPAVVDDEALARSAALVAVGAVRKTVLADPLLRMIPAAVFTRPAAAAGHAAWLLAYAVALYDDVAGYTSIVRGASLLFGLELSPNFACPFFARSFTEFWNRWHITLSTWLRDYVYLPLSRALLRRNLRRRNVPNLLLPPMAAMLASGLWHGPGPRMPGWGALHGVFLIAERLVLLARPRRPAPRPAREGALAGAVVFVAAVLALIPFRMELPVAAAFTRCLATAAAWTAPDPRLGLVVVSFWLDWVQWRRGELVFLRWPRLVRAGLLAAAALATFLATRGDAGPPF